MNKTNDIGTLINEYNIQANELAIRMGDCFEQSKLAFNDGNKGLAKELSNKGKAYKSQLEQLNLEIKGLKELLMQERQSNKEKNKDKINYIKNDLDLSYLNNFGSQELSDKLTSLKESSDKISSQMSNYFQLASNNFSIGNKAEAAILSDKGNSLKVQLSYNNEMFKYISNLLKLRKEKEREEKNKDKIYSYKDYNNYNGLSNNIDSNSEFKSNKWSYENIDDTYLIDLRKSAEAQALKMISCFKEATYAFETNDKAKAKELSNLGNQYKLMMEEFNNKARDHIFTKNNKDRQVSEIDLHGLLVNEAISTLEERIVLINSLNQSFITVPELIVIHGKGFHSEFNKCKIKSLCEDYLNKQGMSFVKNTPNDGCLTILFS